MYYDDEDEPVINSGIDLGNLILEKTFGNNSAEEMFVFLLTMEAMKTKDAFAEFRLGEHFYLKKDYGRALFWLGKSAEQGYSVAQYYLGEHFFLKKDYERAFFWLTKSAEQGYSVAQYYLATCYEEGLGTFQSFEKAAEQGYYGPHLTLAEI